MLENGRGAELFRPKEFMVRLQIFRTSDFSPKSNMFDINLKQNRKKFIFFSHSFELDKNIILGNSGRLVIGQNYSLDDICIDYKNGRNDLTDTFSG